MVRLTSELGISPNATRAALCRLGKQGWLDREEREDGSYYVLNDLGRERLEEVHPRIFSLRHGSWDGRWTILTYSVPERLARYRDRLRRELTFLGYGPMTPSTWISPNPLVEVTLRHLSLRKLDQYVHLFRAQESSLHAPASLIKRCYRLDTIQHKYARFIRTWKSYRKLIKAASRPSDSECFVAKIRLLYDFGDFLYLDPFLPAELLPSDWLGYDAWRLFRDTYLLLMEPALNFFEDCCNGMLDSSGRITGRQRALTKTPSEI